MELQKIDSRNKIYEWENIVKQHKQIELEVKHIFSHGVYARELHIPAGVILTGHVHKFENLNILSKGRISVLTEQGMIEVEAPFTIVSPPGTKRIAKAITDCIWTTIHGTFETDLNIIENSFIATTEQEWLEFSGANQLTFGFN
jgi:hypothetical protein